MCNRETLPATRAMCGCHTRRGVAAVITAVAVVAGAWLLPSFELFAFVAAFLAAVAIVGLAAARAAGFGGLVHRYTPAERRQAELEDVVAARLEWWERPRGGEVAK